MIKMRGRSPMGHQKQESTVQICNFSGENTNTTKEIFFGGVFLSMGLYEKAPSGRELPTKSGEGERDTMKIAKT